jgi:carboxyl-terminal processing protease
MARRRLAGVPTNPRRALRVTAYVTTVALAYAGGVLTGVVGSSPTGEGQGAGVLDEAADRIASQAARPVDRDELERAAVEGMLKALGDEWSAYYPPTEYASFQDALEGHYTGVGLWLRPAGNGGIVVGSVQDGSPASVAGVQAGDLLLGVDGVALQDASAAAAAGMLRGAPDTEVVLELQREDGKPRSYTVRRVAFSTRDVATERLHGDVTRIGLAGFSRGVGSALHDIVTADPSAHAGGIVLDLRGNPGGLLDEAVAVASVFLDGGPVVRYETREHGTRALDAPPGGDARTPLVVLVDADTASSAEVVAAALQDRNRAVVVGSRTYGKGSVQEPTALSDGSALELTVGSYVTASGKAIEGVGVAPDVELPAGTPPEFAERRAIEVLSGLMAAVGASGRG